MDAEQTIGLIIAMLALGLVVGAGVGFFAGYSQAAKDLKPRYRRSGEVETFHVSSPNGLYIDTPSREGAEDFAARYGGEVITKGGQS